jgi:uncharacterized protein (DUF58 family)
LQIPAEIQKKVKLLELNTRKLVNSVFAGQYHTAFKGQGMTFAEFREYIPGDDVRSIAWPLMARTGKPFIKQYDEERELSMYLLVDISGSTDFGSQKYFKGEVMVHVAALMAFSALRNKDQVGLCLFSDRIEHFVPAGKGRGHVQRILRDLLYFKPKSNKTQLAKVFQHMLGFLKRKSVVFVLSDFMDQNYEKVLRSLAAKHELVAIVINDPAENELPRVGLIDLQDAETGEIITVDTTDFQFRKEWLEFRKKSVAQRDKLLLQAQVDRVDLFTTENYVDPLIKFFKQRNRWR